MKNSDRTPFRGNSFDSGNRKRWRQTGSPIKPPIDDADPIRKFSIDPRSYTDLQEKPAEFSLRGKPVRNFSIDPTSAIRTRLRTPFLRTPVPRLLLTAPLSHRLLVGLCRGAVSNMAEIRENSPSILIGCFPPITAPKTPKPGQHMLNQPRGSCPD